MLMTWCLVSRAVPCACVSIRSLRAPGSMLAGPGPYLLMPAPGCPPDIDDHVGRTLRFGHREMRGQRRRAAGGGKGLGNTAPADRGAGSPPGRDLVRRAL